MSFHERMHPLTFAMRENGSKMLVFGNESIESIANNITKGPSRGVRMKYNTFDD